MKVGCRYSGSKSGPYGVILDQLSGQYQEIWPGLGCRGLASCMTTVTCRVIIGNTCASICWQIVQLFWHLNHLQHVHLTLTWAFTTTNSVKFGANAPPPPHFRAKVVHTRWAYTPKFTVNTTFYCLYCTYAESCLNWIFASILWIVHAVIVQAVIVHAVDCACCNYVHNSCT